MAFWGGRDASACPSQVTQGFGHDAFAWGSVVSVSWRTATWWNQRASATHFHAKLPLPDASERDRLCLQRWRDIWHISSKSEQSETKRRMPSRSGASAAGGAAIAIDVPTEQGTILIPAHGQIPASDLLGARSRAVCPASCAGLLPPWFPARRREPRIRRCRDCPSLGGKSAPYSSPMPQRHRLR